MYEFPQSLRKLIREISQLPSLGEKSATRLAYHLVYRDPRLAHLLAESMTQAVECVTLCEVCFALTEVSPCSICTDPSRNRELMCVVEKPIDIPAIERVGEYRGLYHVLHGLWSPLKGHNPEDIKIEELLERLRKEPPQEVIIATSATVEGDATSLYLTSELQSIGIKVTRLAQGIPKGGELEYADEVTLSRAFMGRR